MDTSLTQYPVIQVKTLRFEYLIIFLNSYEPQIWTQPYFHHNIRKYKVTLAIFVKNHIFLLLSSMLHYIKTPHSPSLLVRKIPPIPIARQSRCNHTATNT